jgi:lactoylglutathione lyase
VHPRALRQRDLSSSDDAGSTDTQVVVGIKTPDVDAAAEAIEANGGGIVKGPYNDAHERRVVVYDHKGNGLVFYSPLAR